MQDNRSKAGPTNYLRALLAVAMLAAFVALATSWKSGGGGIWLAPALAAQPDIRTVKEPWQLSRHPTLILQSGTIREIGSAQGTGRGKSGRRLRLEDARLLLDLGASASRAKSEPGEEPADLITPLIKLLTKLDFLRLEIRRGSIALPSAAGAPARVIQILSTDITTNSAGALEAKGELSYRGQIVNFSASAGAAAEGGRPLRFSVSSGLLNARFDGRARMSNGLQLLGAFEVTAANLRDTARWLTGRFPAGSGLEQLIVKGSCEFKGGTGSLSCQKTTVSLDGNVASGLLSLTLGKARPMIHGTLAAKALDLSKYLATPKKELRAAASGLPAIGNMADAGGGASIGSYRLAMPSIRQYDADLRLSATSVVLGGFEMGETAAAISLNAGKLLIDVAEVKMEGGRGSGQITVDMTGPLPRYRLRGKFEGIEISRLATGLMGEGLLQGRAMLVVDLGGSGRTARQAARALSGKARLTLPDGGSIGIDPRALMRAAAKTDLRGWTAGRQQTNIDKADARFVIHNGVLKAVNMVASAGSLAISCNGNFNLPRKVLDLRLLLGKSYSMRLPGGSTRAAGAKTRAMNGGAMNGGVLHMQGRWRDPTIRLESRPRNIDTPSVPWPYKNG